MRYRAKREIKLSGGTEPKKSRLFRIRRGRASPRSDPDRGRSSRCSRRSYLRNVRLRKCRTGGFPRVAIERSPNPSRTRRRGRGCDVVSEAERPMVNDTLLPSVRNHIDTRRVITVKTERETERERTREIRGASQSK